MKNYHYTFFLLSVFFIFFSCKIDQKLQQEEAKLTDLEISYDKDLNPNEIIDNLGENPSDFINRYFRNINIVEIKNSIDGFETKLANGVEIEFDINGELIKIEGNGNDIAHEIIPKPIIGYIKNKIKTSLFVSGYQYKNKTHNIKLNDGTKYVFNENFRIKS